MAMGNLVKVPAVALMLPAMSEELKAALREVSDKGERSPAVVSRGWRRLVGIPRGSWLLERAGCLGDGGLAS